jgi:hypothetical protein
MFLKLLISSTSRSLDGRELDLPLNREMKFSDSLKKTTARMA